MRDVWYDDVRTRRPNAMCGIFTLETSLNIISISIYYLEKSIRFSVLFISIVDGKIFEKIHMSCDHIS